MPSESSETDPKAAMDDWMAAKKGLTLAERELKAAQAGQEVAARCEREAWEKIARLCGREPLPSAPPQAAPAAHVAMPPLVTLMQQPLISSGRLVQQDTSSTFRVGTTPMYSASNGYFDTRAR